MQNGGKLIGSVAHPFSTPDLSSFILPAQSSKAKIIGLASGPPDNVNAIKLGGKFGIFQGGQQMAGLLVLITDVNALGLKAARGLLLTTSLLLGYRRQNPRMVEAFIRQDQPDADDVASRRLFDGDALSQSDRSGRHQRAAQGRG